MWTCTRRPSGARRFITRRAPHAQWESGTGNSGASPEDGPSELLTCVRGVGMAVSRLFASTSLSPDERWLALPMIVGVSGNIGVMPVDGGTFTPVLDFGDRATLIARQVSWAPDGQSIYAAVADVNADIVLLDGLI